MKKRNHTPLFIVGFVVVIMIVFYWLFWAPSKDQFILTEHVRTPIYCINLASEEARRKHILDKFGGYVEMVEAIDTRENKWMEYSHYLTEEGLKQMKRSAETKRREQHHELTPGAIGCFLSHIKCWNKFLDTYPSDSDFIFILEDDTMPKVSFDKTFTKISQNFPPRCDVLLCSYLYYGQEEKVEHGDVEYKFLRPHSAFYLLNAYFITARGIKKILNDLYKKDNKFEKQLDSYLSDLLNDDLLNVFVLKENECFQVGISPTSIQTYTI